MLVRQCTFPLLFSFKSRKTHRSTLWLRYPSHFLLALPCDLLRRPCVLENVAGRCAAVTIAATSVGENRTCRPRNVQGIFRLPACRRNQDSPTCSNSAACFGVYKTQTIDSVVVELFASGSVVGRSLGLVWLLVLWVITSVLFSGMAFLSRKRTSDEEVKVELSGIRECSNKVIAITRQ